MVFKFLFPSIWIERDKNPNKWGEVFKNGTSKKCGRQPFKNLTKFFKGCLPQILLASFLITLSQIKIVAKPKIM